MRASLLASAIASMLRCSRRDACSIQGHKLRIAAFGRRASTTCAACTNSVRKYLLPRLEILPRIVRSPVDSCFGTRPSQAPKSRRCVKPAPLPIAATTELEMIGPTPGTVITRWQASSCSASDSISADTAAMRSSSRRQSWTSSAMRLTILGDSAPVFKLRMSGSALRNGTTPCRTVVPLDQEAADLIDHPRPLADETRAHAMQSQQVHLLRRLDRHEVHGWPLHGFRNRLGIAIVVLVTLQERLHVLCREQANIVSKRGKLASDVMRSGTCFHADQAARNVGEPSLKLSARAFELPNNRPALIEADKMEGYSYRDRCRSR